MPESEQQRRWRILREKLERLASVDPDSASAIETIVDELLEGESRRTLQPTRRKDDGH